MAHPATRRPVLATLLAVTLAASATPSAATRAQRPAAGPPGARALSSRVISPGLLVVVREDHAVPAVAVTALVGAGSVDESPEQAGSAHFLEHLLFNGTVKRTQAQLYREVDELGLYNNAFTRREYTAFQLLGRAAVLGRMLDIQFDMLFGSTLPEAAFEKERGIILEEIAKDATGPRDAARAAFDAQVLAAGPATGTAATVSRIGRNSVAAYHAERYVPANVVLFVNGAVDAETAFRAAAAALPRGVRGRAQERRRRDLPWGAEIAVTVDEDMRPRAWWVHAAPAATDADFLATLVLVKALDERLADAVPGLTMSAWLEVSQRTPVLVVEAVPAEGGLPLRAAAAAARAALDSMAAQLDDEFLDRIARAMQAEEVIQAEQPHYYAFYRAEILAARGLLTLAGLAGLPETAPPATIRDLAKRLLAGPRVLALAGDASSPEQGDVGAPGVAQTQPAAVVVGGSASEARADRVHSSGALSWTTLASGLRLVVEHAPDSGVVSAVVVAADKRRHEEPLGLAGAAEVLHRALLEGTVRRTRDEVAADLSALGATVKVVDDPGIPFDDYQLTPAFGYLKAKAPAGSAAGLLRLLAELVTQPVLGDSEVDAGKQAALVALRSVRSSPRDTAAALFERRVLQRDPWPARGSEEGVSAVTSEAVRALAASWLAPDNLVLGVTGPLAPAEVRRLVEAEFRDVGRRFPRRDFPAAATPASPSPPPAGPSEQAWVMLGQALDPRAAASPALAAAALHLSERVANAVREQAGLAYSVGAAISDGPPAAFRVSFGTRPENVERASTLAREVVRAELQHPFDPGLFAATVQRNASRQLMRRLPSDNRAFQAALDLLFGRSPVVSASAAEGLATVTPEEARTAAAAVLAPESWQTIVAE